MLESKKVVLFYVKIKDISLVYDVSFYEQDIRVLKDLGFDVIVTNKYLDCFLKKYDFIYIWWWSYALIPLIWSKIKGAKSIVAGAFHYSTPLMPGTDFVRKSLFYKLLVKMALKISDANIFVSKYEFDDVVNNLQVNSPYLVHHGIDVDKYTPNEMKYTSENMNVKPKRILIISWLETNNIKRKCIYESVLAFDYLASRGANLELIIAGRKGNGFDDFYSKLSVLQSFSKIKILGHVTEEEKINLLRTCDIYLSPTLYEGFGIAIAEALACGCPVVTSNYGAVGEVVGNCAVYVDPKSVDDIAKNLSKLLNDPLVRLNLSKSGRERVVNLFSYGNHRDKLANVINNVYG
ncbi:MULTISPECIES: glycosyltransferase family 4 protein [Yersinia pseudotuberculosis complex]|uniref:WbyU protein n=2 Tax=Yersinia pseudotuberculosis complex TaxID=1649845 RepID=B7ZEW4_YERPU|nr:MULTISPECIES: glycosyltransferase family 4 protein [Yersinia pseudotuberculosis complex]AKA20982.1 WbyU [Yersinia pseudotuberculosis]CAX18361.1 wbyU [Yersinia pseudotuberculosis]CRG49457.1 group 1 glycosyl transferase [Yersinia wautersii]CRY69919.1 group 1 glycosyl transferase [Yersinia pseudotuberculosis]